MIVLNVGGGANRELPSFFEGWDQHVLDIDPNVSPDVCCDAKDMGKIKRRYDAIYCSHNLEHFYRHEVPTVLSGFIHVLPKHGFAHISVPDLMALVESMRGRDIADTWYRVSAGGISFHDVLYGWNMAMENGNLFYAHKCGFSEKSLGKALKEAGFVSVMIARDGYNLHAFAFRSKPEKDLLTRLGL